MFSIQTEDNFLPFEAFYLQSEDSLIKSAEIFPACSSLSDNVTELYWLVLGVRCELSLN